MKSNEDSPTTQSHKGVFDFSVRGVYHVEVTDDVLRFTISVEPSGSGLERKEVASRSFELPRDQLGSAPLSRLCERVDNNLQPHLEHVLADVAAQHFADVVNHTLLRLNPPLNTPARRQQIISDSLTKTEQRLRVFFGVPRRGRLSPWTSHDLRIAVLIAAHQVQISQPSGRLTAAKVAKRIRKTHGKKAPPSGKALLQLIQRHGLKWADLLPEVETATIKGGVNVAVFD
jgi:hypothetical protein